jgi:hypothetical protein
MRNILEQDVHSKVPRFTQPGVGSITDRVLPWITAPSTGRDFDEALVTNHKTSGLSPTFLVHAWFCLSQLISLSFPLSQVGQLALQPSWTYGSCYLGGLSGARSSLGVTGLSVTWRWFMHVLSTDPLSKNWQIGTC